MAMPQELRSRLLELVRQYRQEHKEEFGAAKRFQELEDEACELGDAVAAAMVAERLAEQALRESAAAEARCPRCQRPGKRDAKTEPREVQTRRGEVAWQEPKYYCRHCRQAFFPSVPRVGH